VTKTPPLVVLVLGGVAERRACPDAESPLALAATPNLDRLAREGRVFGAQLVEGRDAAQGAAPLLALLGIDPAGRETARASYLGAYLGEELEGEECFVSADFLSLFRDLVADAEPDLRPKESEVLVRDAAAAVQRAGFKLVHGAGAHHLAIAPRASVDEDAPSPLGLLGRPVTLYTPRLEQHAFAHRLAREALDGHEINEVRRDLGGNGADALWLWGPGGVPRLEAEWDARVSAFGADAIWRGVCKTAGVPLRAPKARSPAQLVRGVTQALNRDALTFLYARRGVRDALQRDARTRADGVADLDRVLVGPVAKAVAEAGGRLLVVPDTARDTESGGILGDPVPVLLWGAGVTALLERPFTEAAGAAAGEPVAPGHGLLAYVRHL